MKCVRRYYQRRGDSRKVKYFIAAEYGKRGSKRPHYHVILFNVDKEVLAKCWNYGHINFDRKRGLSRAAIAYTLKYMCKYVKEEKRQDFRRMSTGIGRGYLLKPARLAWHRSAPGERQYVPLAGGVHGRMPRYWKVRIFTKSEIDGAAESWFRKKWAEEIIERALIGGDVWLHQKREREKEIWERAYRKEKKRDEAL
jgi:hypothetical protein